MSLPTSSLSAPPTPAASQPTNSLRAVAPTAWGRTGSEQKGERRRRRHEATQRRHEEHAALLESLRRPPTDTVEFAARWDKVYTSAKPYKDRHVLRALLPDLVSESVQRDPKRHIPSLTHPSHVSTAPKQFVLEVGCGTGSSIFPLLRANPSLHGLVFDISEAAIAALRASEEYCTHRLHAFRADACDAPSFSGVVAEKTNGNGCDFATLVWTLSAMDPVLQAKCVAAVGQALKPGALVYLRDFACGDMRHVAFTEKHQIGVDGRHNLFLRGDGTYAYFFDAHEVKQLFEASGLYKCEECGYEQRQVENRKEGITMHRRWVVAKFRRV